MSAASKCPRCRQPLGEDSYSRGLCLTCGWDLASPTPPKPAHSEVLNAWTVGGTAITLVSTVVGLAVAVAAIVLVLLLL